MDIYFHMHNFLRSSISYIYNSDMKPNCDFEIENIFNTDSRALDIDILFVIVRLIMILCHVPHT